MHAAQATHHNPPAENRLQNGPPVESRHGTVRPGVLYLLFTFSGMAGLVYEVMWMRCFSLVFGSTTRTASAVLASFFGGLALGSLLGARLADRRESALHRYGIAELAVAGGALLVQVWLALFYRIYPVLYQAAIEHAWLLTFCKLLLAFVAMGVPAVAMGATLPLMARALVTMPGHVGRRVGLAYGLNTLGATVGVMLAGFVLPPTIGTQNSIYLAAAISALTGFVAIGISRRRMGSGRAPDTRESRRLPPAPLVDRGLLFVVAASGCGALGLEVLYTRLLVNVTDASVFSFALMLATFLVLLALASLLVSLCVDRLQEPWRFLAWTQAAAGLTILTAPAVFRVFQRQAAESPPPDSLLQYFLRLSLMSAATMGPTVLLIGLALPSAWKIATRHAAESGRRVGRLTGLNTLAAVIGSVVAGFGLVPTLGLGHAFALFAAVYALVAIVSVTRGYERANRLLGVAAIAALFAGLILTETWRSVPVDLRPGERLLHYVEGESVSLAVTQDPQGARYLRVNNRYLLGSSAPGAIRSQRALGGLPLALHPDPKSVAFIGVATGVSVSSILDFPVQRAVAVELLPEVLDATRFFERANRRVLRDPRVTTLVADGRNHLFATPETFDVIVGDLFVPWHAGTAYLYTTEHFRNVSDRLSDGGIFAQWLSAKQVSASQLRTVTATFLDVFPAAALWTGGPQPRRVTTLCLMGARDSAAANALERRQDNASPYPGVEFICGRPVLRAWSASASRNTDDLPRIEFIAAAGHFDRRANQEQLLGVLRQLRRQEQAALPQAP